MVQKGESWLSWKKEAKTLPEATRRCSRLAAGNSATKKSRGVLSNTMTNTYDARQARRKMDENEDRKLEIENMNTT